MPKFSQSSEDQLKTCDIRLQQLFNAVVEKYDCKIIEGHRGEELQNKYFELGKSQLRFPNGNHNKNPSMAVDAAPWIPERGSGKEIPWPAPPWFLKELSKLEIQALKDYIKEWMQMAHFSGYVKGTADTMNIKIRSGLDWDLDNNLSDNNFDDAPHFELVE